MVFGLTENSSVVLGFCVILCINSIGNSQTWHNIECVRLVSTSPQTPHCEAANENFVLMRCEFIDMTVVHLGGSK